MFSRIFKGSSATESRGKPSKELLIAAKEGSLERVVKLLSSSVDINTRDVTVGATALHLACEGGHRAVVEALLARGALLDLRDKGGQTPLHSASCYGQKAVLELLLAKQVGVEARNNEGQTPLHLACYGGHATCVELLLLRGAAMDVTDNEGKTPLHLACVYGHRATVELLVARGADFDVEDKDGSSPLRVAEREGHGDVAKLMRDHRQVQQVLRQVPSGPPPGAEQVLEPSVSVSRAAATAEAQEVPVPRIPPPSLPLPQAEEQGANPFSPAWPQGYAAAVHDAAVSSPAVAEEEWTAFTGEPAAVDRVEGGPKSEAYVPVLEGLRLEEGPVAVDVVGDREAEPVSSAAQHTKGSHEALEAAAEVPDGANSGAELLVTAAPEAEVGEGGVTETAMADATESPVTVAQAMPTATDEEEVVVEGQGMGPAAAAAAHDDLAPAVHEAPAVATAAGPEVGAVEVAPLLSSSEVADKYEEHDPVEGAAGAGIAGTTQVTKQAPDVAECVEEALTGVEGSSGAVAAADAPDAEEALEPMLPMVPMEFAANPFEDPVEPTAAAGVQEEVEAQVAADASAAEDTELVGLMREALVALNAKEKPAVMEGQE